MDLQEIAQDLLSVGGYRSESSASTHLGALAVALGAAHDNGDLGTPGAGILDFSLRISRTAEDVCGSLRLMVVRFSNLSADWIGNNCRPSLRDNANAIGRHHCVHTIGPFK